MSRLLLRRLAAASALLAACAAAFAHDSWLSPGAEPAGPGLLRVELAVGAHFPVRDPAVAASSITRAACVEPQDREPRALLPREEHDRHVELRARADAARGVACWAELRAHEVTLTPEVVQVYFAEIRPPEAVKQLWAQQLARGVAWRESYRKFLRMEAVPAAAAVEGPGLGVLRRPRGLAMEILPVGTELLQAGRPAAFQVLLDGRPLAGQWVQMVSERHSQGVWRQTDAQGTVREALPFGGQWLLRATHLEPPAQDSQPWRSRFATLVVNVR